MNISEAINDYVQFLTRQNYSPATQKKYAKFLTEKFKPYLDANDLPAAANVAYISYSLLNAFRDSLTEGRELAAKTRAGDVSKLRAFGRWLQEEADIEFKSRTNPFLRLRPPRLPYRIPRARQRPRR